jgi:hypothetical protein
MPQHRPREQTQFHFLSTQNPHVFSESEGGSSKVNEYFAANAAGLCTFFMTTQSMAIYF